MSRRVGALPLLLFLALAASGCSFFTVEGPPAPRVTDETTCTTGRAVPIIDLLFSAAFVSLAVAEGGESADDYGNEFGLVVAIPGLVYGLSAFVGFDRVSDCRKALEGSGGSTDER